MFLGSLKFIINFLRKKNVHKQRRQLGGGRGQKLVKIAEG